MVGDDGGRHALIRKRPPERFFVLFISGDADGKQAMMGRVPGIWQPWR